MKAAASVDRRYVGRRLGFDIARFDVDLIRACNARGLSRRKAAVEIGLPENTLYCITHRRAIPSGVGLAAICRWSGLDAADYSIDLDDET